MSRHVTIFTVSNNNHMANFTFEKLTAKQSNWYGVNEDCYIVRFGKCAPIEKLASIVNGRYTDNPKTGYLHGNGNTGTTSLLLKNIEILNSL